MPNLMHGDCLELMATIPDGSVDMVMADLPYGTTACKWDSVIPFAPLWAAYRRVCKPTAAIVLTSSQPFTAALVMSNVKAFRHEWIWEKNRGSNFLNVKREPMKEHESVIVFSNGGWTYSAQMQGRKGKGPSLVGKAVTGSNGPSETTRPVKPLTRILPLLRVPSSVQRFVTACGRDKSHPTQKPVDLMAYLIRTYTNPGETVLENTMGSGTTGVAAVREGRNFIGIEQDAGYFAVAQARIAKSSDQSCN